MNHEAQVIDARDRTVIARRVNIEHINFCANYLYGDSDKLLNKSCEKIPRNCSTKMTEM